jgi:cellulose biosynthesis protein BcsQ
MIISIYSTKGGVGKTSLAYSLAKDLNLGYITNDMSIALSKYSRAKYYSKPSLKDNFLYDFGGFRDKNAEEIALNSDIVIIPVINDANSVMRALEALKKFKEKENVFVLANMIETRKDLEDIKMVIKHHFQNREILFFRKSKLLKNAMESGKSVLELINDSNRSYLYKNPLKDYNNILGLIKNIGINHE